MDRLSSFRSVDSPSLVATFDALSNEIVENICRFLKLQDIGSLMCIDSGRYEALRPRIADIGIHAIDTDLHEGRANDAIDRIRGLADWLGSACFAGPEDNEIRAWEALLERTQDARIESQRAGLSEYLMVSIWRRMEVEVMPSPELTDRLLEIFIRVEDSREEVCKDTSLLFGHLMSMWLDNAHVKKMTSYGRANGGEAPAPVLECMMSRMAAICAVRLKVITLSPALGDKLKALYRAIAELELFLELLPNSFSIFLIQDVMSIGRCYPKSIRQAVQARLLEFEQNFSKDRNKNLKHAFAMGLMSFDFGDGRDQAKACVQM